MVDFKKLLEESKNRPGNLNNYVKRIEESKLRHDIENRSGKQFTTQVSVTVAGADYAIRFGYDSALLKKLKDAVPESERTWHKAKKVWLVSPEFIQQAKSALEAHTQTIITLPELQTGAAQVLEKSFLLEYLGTTKDRGKHKSAYGSVNGEWSAEFPEDILKNFFEGRETNQKSDGLQTLYQALCIFESAGPEQIKKAYRRLARQWHPDVCSEPEAAEMFRKINESYQVLIDPEKRKRYDAGLYFERQGQQEGWATKIVRRPRADYQYGYRAPLRCGQITARGTVRLMRFIVQEILKWDDVIDKVNGKVMTSTWPKDAKTFQILWI